MTDLQQEVQPTRFFQGLAGREWKVTAEGTLFRANRKASWTAVTATAAVLEQSRGVREVYP